MFGDKGKPTMQFSLRFFMNTRMTKGTLVKDHIIHIIALFNEMKIFGVEINRETQVDMILETLLNSLKQVNLNYTMNKLMVSLLELIREL